MKKTLQLFCALILFILFGCFMFSLQNRTVQFRTDENNMPFLTLKANGNNEILHPWFDESSGLYYFFLPSFVDDNHIYFDSLEGSSVSVDGLPFSRWSRFDWDAHTLYTICCNEQEYPIVFMKSANLPSLFLETESGSMEYLNADKANEETGRICLINQTKNVDYQGNLKRVSGRGNSSFSTNKKAYSFTLSDSYPLCGLDAGKKWNLLALYYEYDKIHTKLVYDMADYLDMEYNPGCTWVDLYCNGEYQGLYLLTEAITVGEGRVEIHNQDKDSDTNTNISGGYLIEREREDRLEASDVYFTTDMCNYLFPLKNPELPSDAEIDYIKNYIQNIENLILAEDENYKNYIDIDSFAKQFLIDKIVLEPDAMLMSSFYYKDRNSDILKSGPLWDYDRAFGTALPDFTSSIEAYPDSMNDWYMTFYQDEEFYTKVISYYKQLLPLFDDILNNRIDEYVEMLAPSIAMDTTLRPILTTQNTMMSYAEYESYVKYLKYFLANRLNYLNELWGISYDKFTVPSSTGEYHTVNFIMDDGTLLETRQIKDGESLENLPELDSFTYSGWQFYQTGNLYTDKIPVYEDITFTSKLHYTNEEEFLIYIFEKITQATSLSEYLSLIAYDEFSLCIYIDENSPVVQDKDTLATLKALSAYEQPAQLDSSLASGQDYFLLIDNGWQSIWESSGGEALTDLNTTFGPVNYGMESDGDRYLYILNKEQNYLSENMDADIVFVVVQRVSGRIGDIAAFKNGERITK